MGRFIVVGDYYKPLQRMTSGLPAAAPIVAYDFETTRIPKRKGDPLSVYPTYLTVWGDGWHDAFDLDKSYKRTGEVFAKLWRDLEPRTLLCAYNANRFDLRVLLQALLETPFVAEPFASRMHGLRGAIVRKGNKRVQLLDPIAMLGLACDLKTFVNAFAPHVPKAELDLDEVPFDPDNLFHRQYALRDSEALYEALVAAQKLIEEFGGERLRATVGSLAIRSFMRNMPRGVRVPHLRPEAYRVVRKIVMRGGYVHAHRYRGPLWTYDLNQAYAHAMRACDLPAGQALPLPVWDESRPSVCAVALRRKERAPLPYIVREIDHPYRAREIYGDEIVATWLTGDEVKALRALGWEIAIAKSFAWEGSFRMTEFVDGLEARRKTFEPGDPREIIVKAIGCNAYGKSLQEQQTMRVVLSKRPPAGGFPFVEADEAGTPVFGLWLVPEARDTRRKFMRPQIGSFITAYIRTIVYAAALADAEHFVKADTDSVSFTRPQPQLDCDPHRYGAWKCESAGDFHIVVGKKVSWSAAKTTAKGMRTRDLNQADFEAWYAGEVPVQQQMHLKSWRGGLAPTWKAARRRGSRHV